MFLNTTCKSMKCNEYEFSKNVHQAVIIRLNICLVFFFFDLQSVRILAVLSFSYPTLIPKSSPTPGTNKREHLKKRLSLSYLVCASLGLGSKLYINMSLRPKFGRGNDVRFM